MNIDVRDGLPFVSVSICYRERQLVLKHVLLDTGSAGTIFSTDVVEQIGVNVEPGDFLNKIRGVGGIEVVYSKYFDYVRIGEISLKDFEVEIGEMDYGIRIDGILGFDFIREANLVIDCNKLQISIRG